MPRAVGRQGSWFARIEQAESLPEIQGKELPCLWTVHQRFGSLYHDGAFETGQRQWDELLDGLLKRGHAIIRSPKPNTWVHHRYVCVRKVSNVKLDGGLKVELGNRVCELDN